MLLHISPKKAFIMLGCLSVVLIITFFGLNYYYNTQIKQAQQALEAAEKVDTRSTDQKMRDANRSWVEEENQRIQNDAAALKQMEATKEAARKALNL